MSSLSLQLITTSISISMTNISAFYCCDVSSGNITIDLPSVIDGTYLTNINGVEINFYKSDATANTITVNCYSGQMFDNLGTNTYVLNTTYQKFKIISCDGNWIVL